MLKVLLPTDGQCSVIVESEDGRRLLPSLQGIKDVAQLMDQDDRERLATYLRDVAGAIDYKPGGADWQKEALEQSRKERDGARGTIVVSECRTVDDVKAAIYAFGNVLFDDFENADDPAARGLRYLLALVTDCPA